MEIVITNKQLYDLAVLDVVCGPTANPETMSVSVKFTDEGKIIHSMETGNEIPNGEEWNTWIGKFDEEAFTEYGFSLIKSEKLCC